MFVGHLAVSFMHTAQ